jgi:tRNA(Ile)-lysidine synthase
VWQSGDVEVVRPLLTTTRADVLAYLQVLGQPYRRDRSNEDLHRTRNRIRHELLPDLERRYNPAIVAVLSRLAEQTAEVFADVALRAQELLERAERPRAGGCLILDVAVLRAAPRDLVREALRLAWSREGWPLGAMGFAEWDRLAGLALGEGGATDFPGRVRARCRARVVQIGPGP